jgi:hypothetical protein
MNNGKVDRKWAQGLMCKVITDDNGITWLCDPDGNILPMVISTIVTQNPDHSVNGTGIASVLLYVDLRPDDNKENTGGYINP